MLYGLLTYKKLCFRQCRKKIMVSLNPVRILKHEADEEKAEVARLSSFVGAMAIGDLVKSTLGPKGMDKILMQIGQNGSQVEVGNNFPSSWLLMLCLMIIIN